MVHADMKISNFFANGLVTNRVSIIWCGEGDSLALANDDVIIELFYGEDVQLYRPVLHLVFER